MFSEEYIENLKKLHETQRLVGLAILESNKQREEMNKEFEKLIGD